MRPRKRGGKVYYYARFPGQDEIYLAADFDAAVEQWHVRWKTVCAYVPSSFTAVADGFRKHHFRRIKPKTQTEYAHGLKRLEAVFGAAPVETITPKSVRRLRDELADTPVQANRLLALLSTVWNWARAEEITVAENPCALVEKLKERRRTVLVTPEMYFAVYAEADQALQDWMRLTWMIGDRVSDVLRLRTGMIRRDRGVDWLYATAAKTETEGRMRIIGDLARVIDELKTRQRAATGPWLIQTHDGQRVTYAMLRTRFDTARAAARKKAEDAGLVWHDWQMRDLRKASLNQAATLEEARRRGKHADPRTTARHYELVLEADPAALPMVEDDGVGKIASGSTELWANCP